MNKPKIAFVIQRIGLEVGGGSEAYCLEIARRMSKHWDIEIITTCALDYTTWENHYPEGIEDLNGVTIRRFLVDHRRDPEKFNDIYPKNIEEALEVTPEKAEQLMEMQGPNSASLLAYIEASRQHFDKFLFFTYLYGPTYFGLPLVEDKAYLVSTAHDEVPIYFPMWPDWFKKPQGFIFLTPEEKSFLQGHFPEAGIDGEIAGMGSSDIPEHSNIKFRQKYDIYTPYILYVGRIDLGKGCDELFRHFIAFKERHPQQLKLVLAGKPVISIPDHPDILHLGYIDEDEKYGAIEGCEFLVNSSPFESLSIVLLEAWALDKPVLVNGRSEVMVGQCERTGGGLAYLNFNEFEQHTRDLLEKGYQFSGMSAYMHEHYDWDIIERKYLQGLGYQSE